MSAPSGTDDELAAMWQALCEQLTAGVNAWDWANDIPADPALRIAQSGIHLAIPSRARPEFPRTREVSLSRGRTTFFLTLSDIGDTAKLTPLLRKEGLYRIDMEGIVVDLRQATLVILKRALF